IESHPEFIWPESRRNETLAFVKRGLKDFSVSRPNVSWGIPVPDDSKHTIYVWFDALINYLTYGIEENCWPADIHVLGKDNLRFHAIFWPAMLKSAGYELPKTILVHDFITLNGQKVSKSLGNVILPSELVTKFGVDGVRYYFLRFGPLTNDVDITLEKIQETYNADLANGLGNLVARVAKLAERVSLPDKPWGLEVDGQVKKCLDEYRLDEALKTIWTWISELDQTIEKDQPWKLSDEKLGKVLEGYVEKINKIAASLRPFLPETAEKILAQFKGPEIKSGAPLFPRIK
ncbi:MAG: methionine--tRNA ligase, partial [Patescibacteria group bacterium]